MYMWVECGADWMVYFCGLMENICALLTKILMKLF